MVSVLITSKVPTLFTCSNVYLLLRDTVASVGLIPRRLPFTKSNSVICTFRHAISLDEHRAKFKANLYNRDDKADDLLGITEQQLALHKGKLDAHHHGMSALERKYAKNRATPTDVDEVTITCFLPLLPSSLSTDKRFFYRSGLLESIVVITVFLYA